MDEILGALLWIIICGLVLAVMLIDSVDYDDEVERGHVVFVALIAIAIFILITYLVLT